jgi:hypothetical protein
MHTTYDTSTKLARMMLAVLVNAVAAGLGSNIARAVQAGLERQKEADWK